MIHSALIHSVPTDLNCVWPALACNLCHSSCKFAAPGRLKPTFLMQLVHPWLVQPLHLFFLPRCIRYSVYRSHTITKPYVLTHQHQHVNSFSKNAGKKGNHLGVSTGLVLLLGSRLGVPGHWFPSVSAGCSM